LGIIVDAFILLKKTSDFKDTKLFLTGGYTADDQPFVQKMKNKLAKNKLIDDATFFDDFDVEPRLEFLESLTLLSVPVPGGEAFGAYQVEALAAGVPIVQPNIGGYPEFIEATGGGILYKPNTPEKLAEAWASLLKEPKKVRKMGQTGLKSVQDKFSMEQMAKNILNVYQSLG
jgi:glycosyltransferase involved in cell wall biosynthesis